jgi:hypothetical protein
MFSFLKVFKIIAGPFSLFIAWWLLDVIFPALPPELQFSLTDGGWGEFLGFLGAGIILSCCVESWKEVASLFKKFNVIY